MNGTSRRKVLAALSLLGLPLVTRAQQRGTPWRITFLTNGTVQSAQDQLQAFVGGLAELGYAQGRHYAIEARWAEGKLERLPSLVSDIVATNPDLVYAPSGIAAQAVKDSGTRLPIVFAFVPDPVAQGFAESLARPGRNMTGLTSTHTELAAKRLELVKDALPDARRIAVLFFRAQAAAAVMEQLHETERAAKALGLTTIAEESPHPDDFERAFAAIAQRRPDALIVLENPVFYTHRARIVELAARVSIPAVYTVTEWVRAGGLMSYGPSYFDLSRRAAAYAVKILNGAAPGNLPIERPVKLELSINTRTARALRLAIPQSVLLRADEVVGT